MPWPSPFTHLHGTTLNWKDIRPIGLNSAPNHQVEAHVQWSFTYLHDTTLHCTYIRLSRAQKGLNSAPNDQVEAHVQWPLTYLHDTTLHCTYIRLSRAQKGLNSASYHQVEAHVQLPFTYLHGTRGTPRACRPGAISPSRCSSTWRWSHRIRRGDRSLLHLKH